MASNIEGTAQTIRPGFRSRKPRMRVMKPPQAFHFRIPEAEPEECDLMDEDELYAYGYKPAALPCSEIKPCSPCEASSSTKGSSALHSVCSSCSTPSLDDDDNDERESLELDEINSPSQSDSGPSISSPSYFDCNLCLRMAREPAVNSCGHLFCAICFQNWLQFFCLARPECPVCKSDVSPFSITLILQPACVSSETPVGHGDLSSGFNAPPPGPKTGLF